MLKKKLYTFVLKMILKDSEKLHLTGKQRSQLLSLIIKLDL